MIQARVQSIFVVQGNSDIPSPKNSTLSHGPRTPARSGRLKPCRTTMSLAAFGGTFVTGGERTRRGCFIPTDEDSAFDEQRVNKNDPFSHHSSLPDELEGTISLEENEEECEPTLAQRLANTGVRLSQIQVDAAVGVVMEDPNLLVDLYRIAAKADGVDDPTKKRVARQNTFALFTRIAETMISVNGKETVYRTLAMRRCLESGKTLIACLAEMARQEKNRGYRHNTATNVLKALGHPDPFASYLR